MPQTHPGETPSAAPVTPASVRVIAACLGRRYSGINASMLSVLPEQLKHEAIAMLGMHIPSSIPQLRWRDLLEMRRDRWRVWHARRKPDMLAGLILRDLLRFRLKLLFTSAAQRRHAPVTRFYYKRMDAIIATTAQAASFLERPATVVPHGVDTNRFHPPSNKEECWAATGLPGKLGIGVFGRIRPSKGSEDAVNALLAVLPQRPDWSAVFVGEAIPQYQRYEKRLKETLTAAGLAHRVHFTGFIPTDEVPRWYQAVSVVVCPSRVEGFGLPCLEGMASGCAVVATRTGAWPDIIQEDVTGNLVNCGNVPELTRALLAVTEDPARVQQMGQLGRQQAVEQYGISNEARGIQKVYDALLGFASRPVRPDS